MLIPRLLRGSHLSFSASPAVQLHNERIQRVTCNAYNCKTTQCGFPVQNIGEMAKIWGAGLLTTVRPENLAVGAHLNAVLLVSRKR